MGLSAFAWGMARCYLLRMIPTDVVLAIGEAVVLE